MSIVKHTLLYAWESCMTWSLSNSHYMLLEVCSIKENYDKTFHTNYYLHCPLFYLLCKYGPFRGHLMSHRRPTQLCPSLQPRPSPMVTQKPWRKEVISSRTRSRRESWWKARLPELSDLAWHPLDTAVWTNASANKRLCLLVKGEWIRDLTVPSLDKRLPSNHGEQQMIG